MSDYLVGLIRTFVPSVVGSFLAWLVVIDVQVPEGTEAALVIGLTGVLTGAYWALVTALAKRWPILNGLLGVNKAPMYSPTVERAQVEVEQIPDALDEEVAQ